MHTFLLVAMLVFAEGYEMVGAEPFKTQAACEAQRQAILNSVYGKMPSGRQFVITCAPILTGGPGV